MSIFNSFWPQTAILFFVLTKAFSMTCNYNQSDVIKTTTSAFIPVSCALNQSSLLQLSILYSKLSDPDEKNQSEYVYAAPNESVLIPLNEVEPCTTYGFKVVEITEEYSENFYLTSSCIAILLGRPTSSKVGMKILSSQDVTIGKITFGEQNNSNVLNFVPSLLLNENSAQYTEISGLSKGTRYWFHISYTIVENGDEYVTSNFSFMTQRNRGEPFGFIITSDIHYKDADGYDDGIFQESLNQIARDADKDLFFDLGDTFMVEKLQLTPSNLHSPYQSLFHYFSRICSNTPLFLVQGNHDGEMGWAFEEPQKYLDPATVMETRSLYYANPYPDGFYTGNSDQNFTQFDASSSNADAGAAYHQDYFAFTWGDALFISLTPFWYTTNKPQKTDNGWDWTLGKRQYEWLYTTLLQNQDFQFKFVFMHNFVGGVWGSQSGVKEWGGGGNASWARYFEMGGYDQEGQYTFPMKREGWNHQSIHEIFKKFCVSTVFKGHDHFWNVGVYDAVIYTTLPKPSKDISMDNAAVFEKGYAECILNETLCEGREGYVKVNVSKEVAEIKYMGSDGNVLRSYRVPSMGGGSCQEERDTFFTEGEEQKELSVPLPLSTVETQNAVESIEQGQDTLQEVQSVHNQVEPVEQSQLPLNTEDMQDILEVDVQDIFYPEYAGSRFWQFSRKGGLRGQQGGPIIQQQIGLNKGKKVSGSSARRKEKGHK